MTNTATHGQVPALHQYTSDLASKCQGVARCISYNASAHEAQAKHTLLEASHALDAHSIRVHRNAIRPASPSFISIFGSMELVFSF